MHSIERYGIVALIFLVVTVVAVLLWDSGTKKKAEQEEARAAHAVSEPARGARSEGASEPDSTLRMGVQPGPRPLVRQELSAEPVTPRSDARTEPELPAVNDAEPAPGSAVGPVGLVPGPAASTPTRASGQKTPATPKPATASAAGPERVTAPAASGPRYVVRAKDTLSEIAQRELGSSRRWPEIVAANPGLDPARLKVGQTLALPAGARSSAPQTAGVRPIEAAQVKSDAQKGGATWKVGPGESLWKISERALGDGKRWREIAALNPKIDPNRLVVGTRITLPAAARSADRGTPIVASASLVEPRSDARAASARPRANAAPSGGRKVQ